MVEAEPLGQHYEAEHRNEKKRINLDLLLEKLDTVLEMPYPVKPAPSPWHPDP